MYFFGVFFLFLIIKGLEKEEELKVAREHLQEHQETVITLRESVSDKADEMSRIQGDLAGTRAALEEQVYFSLHSREMDSGYLVGRQETGCKPV